MKKKIMVLFIFVLSLFTAVQFALAAITPGQVTGGVGIVTVENATPSSTLKLYPDGSSTSIGEKSAPNGTATFEGIDPGKYYVKATVIDESNNNENVSDSSKPVVVLPVPVTITSVKGTNIIDVTGGEKNRTDVTFTLDNDSIPGFFFDPVKADGSGNGKFVNVPAGKNYRVTQTVNGIESPRSDTYVDILPNPVTIAAIAQGGLSDNQGKIAVTGAKTGNILNLYKTGTTLPYRTETVNSPSGHTFTDLPAGTYFVTQMENNAESIDSNVDTIKDEQPPVITLNGANKIRIISQIYSLILE